MEVVANGNGSRCRAVVARMGAERTRWRVTVEAWPAADRYEGRLVFEPDSLGMSANSRVTAPVLRGQSAEDVVGAAYDISEKRLRELLHSLA